MKRVWGFPKIYLLLFIFFPFVISCNNDNKNDNGPSSGGDSSQAIAMKVNLSGSKGMVVTDGSGSSSSVAAKHIANAKYLGIEPRLYSAEDVSFSESSSGGSTLQKVDSEGNVSDAIDTSSIPGEPPKIKTIGISPQGDVYLHFQYNFVYRDQDDDGNTCSDPWAQDSPCSCQIFKSKSTLSEISNASSTSSNFQDIECVDNYHNINNWTQTGDVFQFDAAGAVYYQANLPDSSQSIVYKTPRDKVNGKYVQKEIVNANICVNDFRVTKSGGLFYIGQNCIDGQWGGGNDGSFFRYVAPDGTLKEIARNWWDFKFEPIEDASGDKVLLFGPDPDSNEVAQWGSACLFEWDPSLAQGSRAVKLVTCNNNIWDWLEMRRQIDIDTYGNFNTWQKPESGKETEYATWLTEYKSRCTSSGQSFIGGTSGSPVKNIKQSKSGKAYIVGDISLKNAGNLTCGVEVRGPHCKVRNIPVIEDSSVDSAFETYNKTYCESVSGTWVTQGTCSGAVDPWLYNDDPTGCIDASSDGNTFTYNTWGEWYSDIVYKPDESDDAGNITGHICNDPDGIAKNRTQWDASRDTVPTSQEFVLQNFWCAQPTNGWTTDYKGMAWVDKTTKQMQLRSETTEQVSEMWLIGETLYYSAFKNGVYTFMKEVNGSANSTLLTDFEAYHSSSSPRSGRIMFDGLDFGTNAYTLGDLNPAASDVKASIKQSAGLTGRVKTIVIYADSTIEGL